MDEEQRTEAFLARLKELGIPVETPLYTLTWQDVARVMVETDGFETAANLPTEVLVETLNTVQDGLEYLDWYGNIQGSLRLVDKTPPDPGPEFEDRVSGSDE